MEIEMDVTEVANKEFPSEGEQQILGDNFNQSASYQSAVSANRTSQHDLESSMAMSKQTRRLVLPESCPTVVNGSQDQDAACEYNTSSKTFELMQNFMIQQGIINTDMTEEEMQVALSQVTTKLDAPTLKVRKVRNENDVSNIFKQKRIKNKILFQ